MHKTQKAAEREAKQLARYMGQAVAVCTDGVLFYTLTEKSAVGMQVCKVIQPSN